jgi:hypothetical protein
VGYAETSITFATRALDKLAVRVAPFTVFVEAAEPGGVLIVLEGGNELLAPLRTVDHDVRLRGQFQQTQTRCNKATDLLRVKPGLGVCKGMSRYPMLCTENWRTLIAIAEDGHLIVNAGELD